MTFKILLTELGQTKPVSSLNGVVGFFSWHRLATEIMRSSGELKPDEKVIGFEVGTNVVQFHVTTQTSAQRKE